MVILFLLISFSFLFSLPSYAIEENSGCINCHVNPTGGVMRNDYGSNIYSLDELSIRKWIKDKEFDGYISDNIQIGGEFRIQSYAGQVESSIFPMQIDIHTNIEFNNDISMFMKYGADPEFYILLDDLLGSDWIKIGRTISDYGLKIDDHTSFIRGGNSTKSYIYSGSVDEGLVFDFASTYKNPTLVEFGKKLSSNIYLTGSISTGLIDEKNKNLTLSARYKNKIAEKSVLFGSSFMKEDDFKMIGLYGGFSKGKFTYSYEIDRAYNWINTYESIASYFEIKYKPIQGIHIIGKYDYFDKNYDVSDGSVDRYSFGINIFPLNYIELKFQLREYKLYSIDSTPNTEYLVQLHTWF